MIPPAAQIARLKVMHPLWHVNRDGNTFVASDGRVTVRGGTIAELRFKLDAADPHGPVVAHHWNGKFWTCLGCGQAWPNPCRCPCHMPNLLRGVLIRPRQPGKNPG
jgi:hypothetical protein